MSDNETGDQTDEDVQAELTAQINERAHVGRVKPWLPNTTGTWQRGRGEG